MSGSAPLSADADADAGADASAAQQLKILGAVRDREHWPGCGFVSSRTRPRT